MASTIHINLWNMHNYINELKKQNLTENIRNYIKQLCKIENSED